MAGSNGKNYAETVAQTLKYGREVDVTVDRKPWTRQQVQAFRRGWKDEDYDTARFTGKHACPRCGMRANTVDDAASCCENMKQRIGTREL